MNDRHNALIAARRILAQRLEALERAGVAQIGRAPSAAIAAVDAAAPVAVSASTGGSERHSNARQAPATAVPTRSNSMQAAPPPTRPTMPRSKSAASPSQSLAAAGGSSLLHQPYDRSLADDPAERQQLLDAVNQQVRACRLCEALACQRKQTVFGVGKITPRVVFFGEAPGADEDRLGEPMVGRAGQLLTKIIEACGWKREDVYIMNVLKCRPPDNRNPLPQETANCRPFFERQLEILRPEYIVCVGTVSAQALLETTDSVGMLRGRLHQYRDSTVLVTYHPSYLLRNPAAKKHVWDDMQMLLREMGLPIPGRAS